MYSVSDSYKTAIQDNTRSFSWSGTIRKAPSPPLMAVSEPLFFTILSTFVWIVLYYR